jgi:trehalose/maltose hydrolase-like predicted phosphorylase
MLWEISRYWVSRVEFNRQRRRYEIKEVTGPDEHHPYVDNNAYTNFLVALVLDVAVKMHSKMKRDARAVMAKIGLKPGEVAEWRKVAENLHLPILPDVGLIPQFDGYFWLSKGLQVAGGSMAKSFQMKESGLYHTSQVIKQPDVMMLFAYLNLDFGPECYSRNWDYYEKKCETSSSLSYPVHAICAADMEQPESAYRYFMSAARIDLDDKHNCAWSGVHSACAAGAWYAVVRGIAGIVCREDRVEVHPHMLPCWEKVRFAITWRGQALGVCVTNQEITLTADKKNSLDIPLRFQDEPHALKPGAAKRFGIGLHVDCEKALGICGLA